MIESLRMNENLLEDIVSYIITEKYMSRVSKDPATTCSPVLCYIQCSNQVVHVNNTENVNLTVFTWLRLFILPNKP